MKKQAFMILTTLSLFITLSAASVYAQSDMRLNVNIPLEFSVGNKVLPAGEYVFALMQVGGADAVKIQSADGHIAVFVPTRSARAKASESEARLVFNRYGDEYFLSSVWTSGNDTGHELGNPRAERELIRAMTTSAYRASERQIVPIIGHR